MRFTNNNFVGNRGGGRDHSMEGWDTNQNKPLESQEEVDKMYESIEEEIACSQHESP